MKTIKEALTNHPNTFKPLLKYPIIFFIASVCAKFLEYYNRQKGDNIFSYTGKLCVGILLENVLDIYYSVISNIVTVLLVMIAVLYFFKNNHPKWYANAGVFVDSMDTVKEGLEDFGEWAVDEYRKAEKKLKDIEDIVNEIKDIVETVEGGVESAIKELEKANPEKWGPKAGDAIVGFAKDAGDKLNPLNW